MNKLSYMAISPDYGLQNGPILGAGEMTNPQFVDSISTIDFNYDYAATPTKYGTQTFWNDIADTTSDVVSMYAQSRSVGEALFEKAHLNISR